MTSESLVTVIRGSAVRRSGLGKHARSGDRVEGSGTAGWLGCVAAVNGGDVDDLPFGWRGVLRVSAVVFLRGFGGSLQMCAGHRAGPLRVSLAQGPGSL